MFSAHRALGAYALIACLALVAGACSASDVDVPVAVSDAAAARPTPAPTPTPHPEPRLDPDGRPVPTPDPPGRPDVADPSAEIADVEAVEVEMIPMPNPTPTPSGLGIPTPTPGEETDAGDETDDDPEATATPEPLPTAVGPDGPPIRVAGLITEAIGPVVVAGDVCEGARARFERANRDLELTRPIEMVDCFDDQGDPGRNRLLVDQLTDDGRIFAIVPSTSVALFADDLLTDRHVPYVGVGSLPAYCGFDKGFGFGQTGALGCPALSAATTPVIAVPHIELYTLASGAEIDGLKVALVRSDTIAGELLSASVGLEATLLGAELVLDSAGAPSPSAAPVSSWGGVVDAVNDAGADVVIIDGDRTEGLYTALRQSFDGDVVGTSYTDPVALRDDPDLITALAGSYQISQGFDVAAVDSEAWGRFLLDAAAIGVDETELGRDVLSGYTAADFFVAALQATPDPITPEALHNIVNNGWQYPGIEELVCPGWWPASHVVPYPCAAVAEVTPFEGPLLSAVPLTDFDLVVRTPAEAAIDD